MRNSQPREPWGSPAPISDGSLSLGWPPRGRYPIPYWEGIKVRSVRYPEIPGGRGGEAKIGVARSDGTDRRASTRFTDRGRGGRICCGKPQRNGGASEGIGAGLARGSGVGFAVSYRNRISDPTLFSGPRARIAAPRRDLPIRRAEAWIARGLPRASRFLSGTRR